MTAPLRDRLIQIVVKAILDGGPLGDHASNIADALLASEEWQAREAVVKALAEALVNMAHRIRVVFKDSGLFLEATECLAIADEAERAALARLDAVRGEGRS